MAEAGSLPTAAAEWRAAALLPVAAGCGYATSVIHIYGLGPYIRPLSDAFGWSRTQVTAGLTVAVLVQALFSVPIGLAVDRYGPRRFALAGVPLTVAAFAMLATAGGSVAGWYGLWLLLALATLPIQATVWTSAVASRFARSRGLALAVALCGASLAAVVFPVLGARLIAALGWRRALLAEAAVWAAVALPVVVCFFHGANDRGRRAATAPRVKAGSGLAEGFRSTVYWRLLATSALFTCVIIALVVHMVPILIGRGADPLGAAGLAALVGIFSVVGRLLTGVLLDRLRASLVGAAVFLLPAGGCLLLLSAAGGGTAGQAAAAALVGLALGAEVDVIVYLTTRHFGLRHFGGLYGGLLAALSLGTALGPLAAAQVFDRTGSYAPFLWAGLALMALSSAALASLPRPAFAGPDHA